MPFSQEFAGAKDVKWTANETFYKASFVFNGQYVYAFYQLDGEINGDDTQHQLTGYADETSNKPEE